MVIFLIFVIIGVVAGRIFTRDDRGGGGYWTGDWTGDNIRALCVIGGILLGAGASFLGGSFFVKKEIVVEKYVISPMVFDGKIIAGLMEENDILLVESDNYIFQIKEGDKTKFIKHYLNKRNIFFSLNEDEERYLKIKKSKTFRRRMWIWFFYVKTGIVKSEAVLKKGDSFLTLPRYYSL